MLRPTQSFTVFLQQLGRGLRNVQGKNLSKSLVVIDFVGNFKTAHVAPLALSGYTSIQEYAKDAKGRQDQKLGINKPPKGCFVSSDLEVQRIWDQTLREIVPMPRAEQLKALYNELIQDLGLISPGLCEFYSDPQKADPHVFIKHFGSWIKTKKAFEDLSNKEKGLLGTAGESFLEHLEKDLNPVKSYKMVVLKTIIGFEGASWKVQDIAQGFLEYYLNHPEHLLDFDELARQDNPEDYSLERVVSHILRMPLYYLSTMDIPRIFNIMESAHRIHNPFISEKFATLGAALRLESGTRVLDLGSGSGEMLCTWARDYGVIGTGVDMSQLFSEQARLRAEELGVADQIKFIHDDAAGYVSDEKVDVAACVGATWIGGGVAGTIELLARSLRTGGIILIGEPYWWQLPPTEDIAKGCLANVISNFLVLPELIASFGRLGYDVVEMILANQDGWDRYEAAKWLTMRRWLEANPDDGLAQEVQSKLTSEPERHAAYTREYLGWGVFALMPRICLKQAYQFIQADAASRRG